MKAVLCPVCNGSGKVKNPDHDETATASPLMIACHGCGGGGWVEVHGEGRYYPYPWKPYPESDPWHRWRVKDTDWCSWRWGHE